MDGPAIRTTDLTKIYADFWGRPRVTALDSLTIEVASGEVFGLIGPNGSGKTTTMKLLLGLISPTRGQAAVLGLPPRSVQAKAHIGFLPEESYLYPFLTGEETLDFFGRIFGIPRDRRKRRIDELLELFELGPARRRRVREYSKGMQRRVSFAQALINDPAVLFLDEPTSGLDPVSSRKMKDLVLDLKRKGTTVFLSSHLLADLQDVCDRIALLHEGRLKRYGSIRELLTDKDLVTLTLRGLSPEALAKLREAAQRDGASVVSCDNKLENLESFFLKAIRGESGEAPPPSGAYRGTGG